MSIRVLRVLEYTFADEYAAQAHLAQRAVKDVREFGPPSNHLIIREAFVGGILGFEQIPDIDQEDL